MMFIQIVPPPMGPPPPPGLPIDTGIVFLAILGVLYGVFIIKKRISSNLYNNTVLEYSLKN